MLKPFILDVSSATYEKQFECCKLGQVLLGSCRSPHDYMHAPSQAADILKPLNDLQHHESSSQTPSPCNNPYPKAPSPSFPDNVSASTLCIRCGLKRHRATSCSSKESSCPERPIIVSWKENHLKSADGTHICLHYNVRTSCYMQPSGCHGLHSCSLCGDSCHGANGCTRN